MTAIQALFVRSCHSDNVGCSSCITYITTTLLLKFLLLANVWLALVKRYFDLCRGALGQVALGHCEPTNSLRPRFLSTCLLQLLLLLWQLVIFLLKLLCRLKIVIMMKVADVFIIRGVTSAYARLLISHLQRIIILMLSRLAILLACGR